MNIFPSFLLIFIPISGRQGKFEAEICPVYIKDITFL